MSGEDIFGRIHMHIYLIGTRQNRLPGLRPGVQGWPLWEILQ